MTEGSLVKIPCTTHDDVTMVYHQLLVHREGNFVEQLTAPPWWPTLQSSHAVALLHVPCYGVGVQ